MLYRRKSGLLYLKSLRMEKKDKKDYFKQSNFKPSIQVNLKQVIIIAIILLLIASIPFVYSYLTNPDSKSFSQIVDKTIASFSIETKETDSPMTMTLPLIGAEIDLTIIQQNPQLLVYGGAIFVFIALLIGITLIRNLKK